jgi:hypothetical protein
VGVGVTVSVGPALKDAPNIGAADRAVEVAVGKTTVFVGFGGTGVFVADTAVFVGSGGTGVLVGGIGVFVGGTAVFVGDTGVFVGGTGVPTFWSKSPLFPWYTPTLELIVRACRGPEEINDSDIPTRTMLIPQRMIIVDSLLNLFLLFMLPGTSLSRFQHSIILGRHINPPR